MRASHLGHFLLYGALLTLLSYAEGLFDKEQERNTREYLLPAFKVVFWATLVLGIGLHLCGARFDRWTLVGQASVVLIGLVLVGTLRSGVQESASFCATPKNVLIVGTSGEARDIARHLAVARHSGRTVKGFVSGEHSRGPGVLGTVEELAQIARAKYVDEIIVARGVDHQLAERAVAEALRNHLDVSIVPELFAEWPSKLSVQNIGPVPLIALHQEPIPRLGLFVKRVTDVVISATILFLSVPFLCVIAALIKLDSPGPILYRALRTGKKGQRFEFYKFRTMYADADRNKDALRCRNERQGPTFKITNDPRITPFGRALRRYSLDELPQLWNVLNGTMSMVGPRPHPVDDYQRYTLEDRRRLDVSPGITGLWQVTARSDPSFATNMALDLEYIENWSLRLDMIILLKTIPTIICGTGL